MGQEVRLHQFYNIDREVANELLIPFHSSVTVDAVIPIHSGMSTSNFCIITDKTKYLLKIYSGNTGSIEPVMYDYLKSYINVPSLLYYDASKKICPYSYAVIEYLEGETFLDYIKRKQSYPLKKVQQIGEMLSIIHLKTYASSGLLDPKLQIDKTLKSTKELILEHLKGKSGSYLTDACRDTLALYLEQKRELFNRIDQNPVLNHGDIGYGNIMISDDKVYFIDFEYALAESRYRDIGKFFRNKSPEIQQYINSKVYNAFMEGYSASGYILPEDWMQLARLADIPVMLGLLNIEQPPKEWITDIEHDILAAIH